MNPLLEQLGRTVVVGCGAIGTCLRRNGSTGAGPVELLNLSAPEQLLDLYRAYLDAGAQALITNTFAANPVGLEETGQADRCEDLNAEGVRLARRAAAGGAVVLASVGPLGLALRSEDFTEDELFRVYRRQCEALAGADALLFETFSDPREARGALRAGRDTGLPMVFQIGHAGGGAGREERVLRLARLAVQAGAAAVGANCQHPNDILNTVELLLRETDLPVTASPNAGNPAIRRGVVEYRFPPSAFRRVGALLAERGAALVGGCCGTGPDHICALAAAVAGHAVRPRPRRAAAPRPRAAAGAAAAARPENPVRELLRRTTLTVSVEIRAERNRSLDAIVEGARLVAAAGADSFDVPDNPGAAVGRDAAVVAAALQARLHVPAVCHMAVTQSNLLQLHSRLLGAWDLGVRGLLAVTGDPPSMGHLSGLARRVTDIRSSLELLRLVRSLRGGRMINGEEVADAPAFCTGCAVGQPAPSQVRWLASKVDAGAEFVFSQPVFTGDDFDRLLDAVAPLGVPLFPGLLPLTGVRNAAFFASGRIPGIRVPEKLVAAMGRFDDAADQRRFGLEYALELAVHMAERCGRLYLIMPFGRTACREAADLVRALRVAVPGPRR